MGETIAFWSLAVVLVGSALAVVLSKNLFHSVLWLALALTGTAGVFLLLAFGWGTRLPQPKFLTPIFYRIRALPPNLGAASIEASVHFFGTLRCAHAQGDGGARVRRRWPWPAVP